MKDVITIIQYFISIIINIASIFFCFIGIWRSYSILPLDIYLKFSLLFVSLVFLGYLEGLHFGMVSLKNYQHRISKSLCPRGFKVQSLIMKEAKVVQRFLIGRQFFVILAVFLIAQITTFPEWPDNSIAPGLILVLRCGTAGILITLSFGQLLPQLLCEEYMTSFVNLPGCYSIVMIALFIEKLGISHFSWFLFRISHSQFFNPCREHFNRKLYQPIPDNNPQPIDSKNDSHIVHEQVEWNLASDTPSLAPVFRLPILEWFKFIFSTCLTLGCLLVIGWGISHGYAVLQIHPAALFTILIVCLVILFYLEGLMIAVVSTQRLTVPTAYLSNIKSFHRAKLIHEVCNTHTTDQMDDINNVKRFIMGRQFLTVSIVFLISQITVFPSWPSYADNNSVITFLEYIAFRSGLSGALVVLSVSQLFPQLIASEQPWVFLNFRGSFSVVIASLATEALGLTHFARTLFHSMSFLCWKRAKEAYFEAETTEDSLQTPLSPVF